MSPESFLEAFLVSTGVVALGEMGDKTQLLAIVLAALYRKPWPIVGGIFIATLANHAVAAMVGGWVAQALGPHVLRWVIGVSFLAMAGWMLVPDRADDDAVSDSPRFGVFVSTVVAFFLAEMGDKTQIATVALAARYPDVAAVVIGTTLGMMLANVPAVFLGERIAKKLSMRVVHGIAAAVFAVLGLLTLLDIGPARYPASQEKAGRRLPEPGGPLYSSPHNPVARPFAAGWNEHPVSEDTRRRDLGRSVSGRLLG